MVGGTVIENMLIGDKRRLWCADIPRGHVVADELAVYAEADEASEVRIGDKIWWQGRQIYWSRSGEFTDRPIGRIGYSFDPRKQD